MNNHFNPTSYADQTLLLVNTGYFRKRFIVQKLKKLGLKLVILNKEKNWASQYADHWILADTNNHTESIQEVDKFIKENPDIKINGVITFWEDDVLLTSKLSDKFQFIGIPHNIAKKFRNKYLFRELCLENNIPSPKHKLIHSKEDLEYVAQNFNMPLVIKPTYGSSSALVIKIENVDELKNIYKFVKKNISTSVESALNNGLDILIEEYIEGDEVDIDILLQNGKIKFYSISDNYKTNEPFFIETKHTIPSSLPENDQLALIQLADETLEKLGVQNGCIHFEAKSTHNGPVPLEVNLRMGGDEIYSFIKEAWHVDLIENAVKIALGIYLPKIYKPEDPYTYLCEQDFLADYSGALVQINIDPELKQKKYLKEINFFKQIGDPILAPPEGYENLGWISVTGENLLDAQDNLNEAIKMVHYEIAKFDPASSIGKTSRKSRFSFSALNKDIIIGHSKIEKIRRMSIQNQRNLKIGIACNLFDDNTSEVEKDLTSVGKNIEKTLLERGYQISFFDFNNVGQVVNDLKNSEIDLVFNVCERINNSSLLEPHAAAILDSLQIPYTGSNPFTLSLCIDKIRVKKLLTYHNIPTPKWDYVYDLEDEIRDDFKYPLIVKPANTDNSIGITNNSVVTNPQELQKQLRKILIDIGRPALIEEYIEGDEYDVSILGSEEDDLRILPLSRSIFDNMPQGYWHIYPFEAKWNEDQAYNTIIRQRPPQNISHKLADLLGEIALDTYNILDCHDYGRVEIRVDKNNNPYVLELNPNPSINFGDCVPASAELVGMDYGDFLEEIIRLAIKRYKERPPYYHLQPNII
ncbi:MAG: ATP-grasp domain-containing protein [Patescibacteria group bacterium]|nr:ATP-grasp domain-containing protein [Patescibacteria group bacterium]